MKKFSLLSIATLLSLSLSFPTFAGEWKQDTTGWWYQNDDGSNPANSWQLIGDQWYYFKPNGYMNTGWLKISDQWYYCELTGEMRLTDLQTDVFTFKFNPDGSCSNFYENKTPSSQAGWASYDTGSFESYADALLSGKVIYYNGQYWATPDYVNILKNETIVYYHDISEDTEDVTINRYNLIDFEIPDDKGYSCNIDGMGSTDSVDTIYIM